MNPLLIVKAVTDVVVSVGVGAVVGNAIKAGTPANTHVVKRVAIGIGGFVLSGMVSDYASKYATGVIDNTTASVRKILNKPEIIEEVTEVVE